MLEEQIDRELKEEAEKMIKPLLKNGEVLLYQALSDLKEDATYGRRWLFITNQRVIVVTPDSGKIDEVELRKIKS
jgi:hypothetical protein